MKRLAWTALLVVVSAAPAVVPALVAAQGAAEPIGGPTAAPGIARLSPQAPVGGYRSLSFQECVRCHAGVHSGWKLSMHSVSWVDPEVQEVWAHVGRPDGCRDCHLPLAESRRVPRPDVGPEGYDLGLAAEGVTCAACHVRDGEVLAPHKGGTRNPKSKPPHPVRHEPQLDAAEFCAGCHESAGGGGRRPVYDTFAEWQASPLAKAGVTCQDCHMERKADVDHTGAIQPLRTHLFRGAHSDPMLQEALDVVVRGGAPTWKLGETVKATVLVTNGGAGHRVPTGSPLHAIEVAVGIADERGEFVAVERRMLRREVKTFVPFAEGEDTTLGVGETLTIDFAAAIPADPPAGGAAPAPEDEGVIVPGEEPVPDAATEDEDAERDAAPGEPEAPAAEPAAAPPPEYYLVVQLTYHLLPPELTEPIGIPSEIVSRTYDSRVFPLGGY